jgi:threonine synthase
VLTGNGLKDPDTAISQAGTPVKIGDTLEELLEALSG